MKRHLTLVFAAVISIVSSATFAQGPQRTSATYGDWTVRCVIHRKTKTCEMIQATQIRGRSQPITQIAIGHPTKTDSLTMVFEVPTDVWLPDGVKLSTDSKKVDVHATFTRCVPGGCFAEIDIDATEIKQLSHLKKSGKLQFKDAGKKLIAIPVSFKGFGDAYDALQK